MTPGTVPSVSFLRWILSLENMEKADKENRPRCQLGKKRPISHVTVSSATTRREKSDRTGIVADSRSSGSRWIETKALPSLHPYPETDNTGKNAHHASS